MTPPTANRYDTVLWDFGGVFTSSPFHGVAAYAATIGADPAQLVEFVFGPYHEDTDHPWHRLERGEVGLSDAMAEIVAATHAEGISFEPAKMFSQMGGENGARQDVIDAVIEVRERGLRQVIVTNNVAEYRDGWRAMLDVDALFDDVIDSSVVGLRKPDPAFFHLALQRTATTADRVIFLDDAPGNVVAARALGITTIHVGDVVTAALTELRSLLG